MSQRFMLDTHTLLWALYDPYRLLPQVLEILQGNSSDLLVSQISPWEITDKATKFRLPMAGNSADQIVLDIAGLNMNLLAIEFQDILDSVKLPWFHNDPMDRLLIAQARRYGATLLSKDVKFKYYYVPLLWS